jgi:hypothetical protein
MLTGGRSRERPAVEGGACCVTAVSTRGWLLATGSVGCGCGHGLCGLWLCVAVGCGCGHRLCGLWVWTQTVWAVCVNAPALAPASSAFLFCPPPIPHPLCARSSPSFWRAAALEVDKAALTREAASLARDADAARRAAGVLKADAAVVRAANASLTAAVRAAEARAARAETAVQALVRWAAARGWGPGPAAC